MHASNNIYSPFERSLGGGDQSPCNMPDGSNAGYCAGGMDVRSCDNSLKALCSASGGEMTQNDILDACGGHTKQYHLHEIMENTHTCRGGQIYSGSGHSGLLGVA